ncbi:ribosome biogenesis protein BMS1 homolog [Prorops nasuta]|uniref:ribosome biogenesis protein BMS1 homolog n=1 Tax=Prorops nasuta TaxID=863751 RepID=UPI0034CD0432
MSGAGDEIIKQKGHRERKSGRKADKKKAKSLHVQELSDKQRNPKAFTFNSAVRAERRFRRKQDIETKKQHIPLVDRTPIEPPPVLVAVVGPPKVGKSLVLQCLIKSYVRQPLANIQGPVTVVSGKRRRITFMECNNDINSMIDIAKVADLVLLLVDASFGFEMEIFEFLNICQVHGMPRIMGVLTHLDLIKNAKQLRRTKKILKQRFWTEVYAGAKLFYLSGLLHDEYLRNEVKNLARFISVMKFRPLTWRTTHPYILADRVEDLTSPELIRQNPKTDRTICLYGYVRGVPLNKESSVHIPGCGDLRITDVSFLPDPCPLPEQLKKRALVEKERLIYAPFSGVGGIVYDKDAVYVELGGSHSYKQEDTGLIGSLMETQETLDEKLQCSELTLFTGAAPIKSSEITSSYNSDYSERPVIDNGRIRRKVIFSDAQNGSKNNSIMDELKKICSDDESDDENEEEDNEVIETGVKRKSETSEVDKQSKKLKSSDSSIKNGNDSSDESDDESENEEEEENMSHTKSDKAEESNICQSVKPDNVVKNKILEALNMLDTHLEETKETKTLDGEESFDELSDNESRAELEMDKFVEGSDMEDEEIEDGEERNKRDEEEASDEDKEEDEDDELKWKSNLAQKAQEGFLSRQRSNKNLMKMVYGVFENRKINGEEKTDEKETDDSKDDIGGIFKIVKEQQQQKIQDRELQNQEESSFYSLAAPRDWLEDNNRALLANRFVTGKWKESEDAEELLKLDDMDDDEIYGDFEDLETGEKHKSEQSEEAPRELTKEDEERKALIEKKKKLKEKFDSEYDTGETKTYYDELKMEVEKQAELNKTEFEGVDDEIRVQLEGYRPGMYVRVEIGKVPCELITNLDPTYPLIIGGLLHGEENIGYVQTRIKKHRWYSRILKSRDPLILSVGWRRFQTLPIFSKLEDNMRNRMLKYTPEHVACMTHFWGPITPQGTGVLAIQNVATREPGFRIAATGSIVELNKSTQIVKKLKLTGVPLKIYKKTAFIKDMFNSSLEVAKFEGARIKTVSGIRGQIKKAVSKPEGCFRATFEDKILLSDIIFCRTWYKVDVPKFYNPVTSLLLPPDQKNHWIGMKTTGQLKREKNIKAEVNQDCLYTPVQRGTRVFKPLVIPRSLQKELPYKDKPKNQSLIKDAKTKFENRRVAVVREPKEEKVARVMKMIRTVYAHKQEQLKKDAKSRISAHRAKIAAEEAKKLKHQKIKKKDIFRDLSKMEAKKKTRR